MLQVTKSARKTAHGHGKVDLADIASAHSWIEDQDMPSSISRVHLLRMTTLTDLASRFPLTSASSGSRVEERARMAITKSAGMIYANKPSGQPAALLSMPSAMTKAPPGTRATRIGMLWNAM